MVLCLSSLYEVLLALYVVRSFKILLTRKLLWIYLILADFFITVQELYKGISVDTKGGKFTGNLCRQEGKVINRNLPSNNNTKYNSNLKVSQQSFMKQELFSWIIYLIRISNIQLIQHACLWGNFGWFCTGSFYLKLLCIHNDKLHCNSNKNFS